MFKQKMHTIRQQIIMNEKKNEKITKIENRKKIKELIKSIYNWCVCVEKNNL